MRNRAGAALPKGTIEEGRDKAQFGWVRNAVARLELFAPLLRACWEIESG